MPAVSCRSPGLPPHPASPSSSSEVEGRAQPKPPTSEPNEPGLLRVRGLSKSFRGLRALEAYDLDLRATSIHGVIGPNGAGKTTLFHMLSGLLRPTSGTVTFDG